MIRPVRLRPIVMLAVSVPLVAGCGSSSHAVPDRFSGTWRLNDGRTIPIRRVGEAEGSAAIRKLGGTPCKGTAIYYRSTYFDGAARFAGCATGDGKHLVARFNDRGITGVLDQRLVSEDRFAATVSGDGGAHPFRVVAARVSQH
jgi:hypothetical protein